MQAAGNEDNPFLTDDSGPSDAQQSLLAGETSSSVRAGGPPARPPPPKLNSSTSTSRTSSPACAAFGAQIAPPKSAFDDLNDTIRVALGGTTPPKVMNLFQSGGSAVGLQGHYQPVAGLDGSSSSQQHAFAPATQMFSSPVKGQSAIGGGSL